jgi:hypothetical protein
MMSDTIQHNGYTIIIERDTDTISPRDDYDQAGKMVCWHNRYNLGDAHTWNVDSFHKFKEAHPEHLYLPIYLYEHSGITISTSSFRDPWDSGQVGWTYMEAITIGIEYGGDRELAQKCLEAEVEEYDTYLRGEVYGYIVQKDGIQLDSCWSMYGLDYCKEAAINVIDSYQLHVVKQ